MKKFVFSLTIFLLVMPWVTPGCDAAQNVPQWQQEMNVRAQELESLQRENAMTDDVVDGTEFPKTFADIPFSERMKLASEDIAQYKDLKAYKELDVKTESEWCGDHLNAPECAKYKARLESAQKTKQDAKQQDTTTSRDSKGRIIFKI